MKKILIILLLSGSFCSNASQGEQLTEQPSNDALLAGKWAISFFVSTTTEMFYQVMPTAARCCLHTTSLAWACCAFCEHRRREAQELARKKSS